MLQLLLFALCAYHTETTSIAFNLWYIFEEGANVKVIRVIVNN